MANEPPHVGLLPLYLGFYDEVLPEYRPQMEAFTRQVAERLALSGLAVELADLCYVQAEIEQTIADMTAHGVELLATLHPAYSPSLEAAEVLARSELPLVLLDTTPSPHFAENATGEDMLLNQGLRGVQDLACRLRRCGRAYSVIVGHVNEREFIKAVVEAAWVARAVKKFSSMRVLVFGDEFPGVGDFVVEPEVLARVLGFSVERVPVSELATRVAQVSEHALAAEAESVAERFDCSAVSPAVLRVNHQVGLAVRQMLEEFNAGAFSFNFRAFDKDLGVPTVPFLEASQAMARGLGYAGEGDALTAALVGGLLQGFGQVTFTEMSCPDWAGNAIFMSHMGEGNPALAAERPRLVEKEYVFGNVETPVVAMFPVRPGPATLINLAPGRGDEFGLIVSRVQVLERFSSEAFPDVPHFWMSPVDTGLRDFLRRFSELGGTHHSAVILGDCVKAIGMMANMLGLKVEQI